MLPSVSRLLIHDNFSYKKKTIRIEQGAWMSFVDTIFCCKLLTALSSSWVCDHQSVSERLEKGSCLIQYNNLFFQVKTLKMIVRNGTMIDSGFVVW